MKMNRARWVAVLCCAVAFVPICLAKQPVKHIIAYVFVKDQLLKPEDIAGDKLTTINYAFANIKDGQIVEGFEHDRENFAVLNSLKQHNPQLKILISVGGWTWSGGFSDMTLTRESRAKFIGSAVRFVETYQLDGVDIDWEYPGSPGIGNRNRPADKQNYTALLKELQIALRKKGKQLHRQMLTSVATGGSLNFLEHTEMRKVQKYVDTVNLMSYDYYEPDADNMTGHHAPLYTNPKDPKAISADASVKLYLGAGVPTAKIVLGVPFYGHAWSEVAGENHGLFQPGKMAHVEANYLNIASLLSNGYVRYWDDTASAPYLYNSANRTFVSYEDVESIGRKCQYVLQHKLGGIMFWDYEGDANQELLNAINTGLLRKEGNKDLASDATVSRGH